MEHISIYPKSALLKAWEKDRALFKPISMLPLVCCRCGGPLNRELTNNALSRALDVYVCPTCGTDEAMRDYSGQQLPLREWYAVRQGLLPSLEEDHNPVLTPDCSFAHVFSGPKRKIPLSSLLYPVSEVVYSRSDYDGRKWWTSWFPCQEERVAPELVQEIDQFMDLLLALPEFCSLHTMQRMCKLYAEQTSEPTEYNLYSETEHFYIWLRMITRERDYNLYVNYYLKDESSVPMND